MANKIKNKYSAPRATEFTPKDLVVDVKNGRLYYKSNYAVYEIRGTLFSTFTDVIDEGAVGSSLTTEVIFNNNGLFDGISDFTVSSNDDGTGVVSIGSANISQIIGSSLNFNDVALSNVNVDSGTLDGITSLTAAGDLDIGDNQLTVQDLVVDNLPTNKIVITDPSTTGKLTTHASLNYQVVGSDFSPGNDPNLVEVRFPRLQLNGDPMTFNPNSNLANKITLGKHSTSNALHLRNTDGDVIIGPVNTGFSHFITDRDKFYINKPLAINGSNGVVDDGDGFHITSYKATADADRKADLLLTTNGSDFDSATTGGKIRIKHATSGANASLPAIEIKGNVKILASADSAQVGKFQATNDVIAFASDRRLKENIIKISNPLDKINKLRGVYFDWNKKSEEEGFLVERKQNEIGMIAQEVEEVIPQAIEIAPFDDKYEGTDREKYKTIKYDRIIPLLVECIKEQQKQINKLQKQINEK